MENGVTLGFNVFNRVRTRMDKVEEVIGVMRVETSPLLFLFLAHKS